MSKIPTENIWEELRTLYNEPTRERAATRRLSKSEIREYQKIENKYASQTQFENRCFELEYQTRFETARKRLINEAAAKTRTLRPRFFGRDKFDGSAINRQADRQVRHDHAKLLAHLETKKNKELDVLLAQSQYRQELAEKPKRDFARATNRRSGSDRRDSTRPAQTRSRER